MRRFIVLTLAMAVVLFPLFTYIYRKGGVDGVMHYKHSKNFIMTLYSAYMFGVQDGRATCNGGSK